MENSKITFSAFMTTLGILTATPANAQGVFDMGALTNTLTTNAGTAQSSTPPSPAATKATLEALSFKPSAELRAQNLNKFIGILKQSSPEVGAQLEQGLAGVDLFGEMEKGLSPLGLRVDNMGDAMVAYWLSSWMAANGRTDDPTVEQIAGTRTMLANTLGRVPEITKLSDADKQSSADAMLLQLFFNEAMLEAVASDPAALAKVRGDIKAGVKEAGGLDVDQFIMTPTGLARKK
jgi:hypothetical protein